MVEIHRQRKSSLSVFFSVLDALQHTHTHTLPHDRSFSDMIYQVKHVRDNSDIGICVRVVILRVYACVERAVIPLDAGDDDGDVFAGSPIGSR